MSDISYILEKVQHGSAIDTREAKALAEAVLLTAAKLEACAQEVGRREAADSTARQDDRRRAEELRVAREAIKRLEASLAHERQRQLVQVADRDQRIAELEGLLKDIHYGLLKQPEHSREVLADVIAREVTPYPEIPWGPDHPAYDEMGQ